MRSTVREPCRTRPQAVELTGESLARGAQVGRYVILERIGSGGVGVVYAAYDPELDRRVAGPSDPMSSWRRTSSKVGRSTAGWSSRGRARSPLGGAAAHRGGGGPTRARAGAGGAAFGGARAVAPGRLGAEPRRPGAGAVRRGAGAVGGGPGARPLGGAGAGRRAAASRGRSSTTPASATPRWRTGSTGWPRSTPARRARAGRPPAARWRCEGSALSSGRAPRWPPWPRGRPPTFAPWTPPARPGWWRPG